VVSQKKVNSDSFVDAVFDMALIFSKNSIVYLRDDTKLLSDVVVGDELLGWRGEYRKVLFTYQPRFFHPPMIRFGVGVCVEGKRDRGSFVEVGEQTKIAVRNLMPNYDLVPSPKKARDILLFSDGVEVCSDTEPSPVYKPATVLKLSQKRSNENRPIMIGIEGSCLVVNDIVILGCDAEKIRKFIKKEDDYYGEKFKEKTRNNVSQIDGLRDDSDIEESDVGESL
jgi:hypothetical protein